MDLQRLVYWMADVSPRILNLDGYLFVDRFELGEHGIRTEAATRYESLAAAQAWMNIVLLDEFISEVVGDEWELGDPLVDAFLSVFESAWSYQIQARFPDARFRIDKLKDRDSGDVGLRLTSLP